MCPPTPHSMIKEKTIGNGIENFIFGNKKFEFVQHFFFIFIIELGVRGSARSGGKFVEKKSVHVIAKHRREK